MFIPAVGQAIAAASLESPLVARGSLTVQALSNKHEGEVLAFLAARPIHTVFMAGFIRDNGIVSELNRGTFYGCRDGRGRLEGVALIGHFTFIEARSEAALKSFAGLAQDCPSAHMILGEQGRVEEFWDYFSQAGSKPRRVCRELLLEQRGPVERLEPVDRLRQANPNDLPIILPVNAEMVYEESGLNPLEVDATGFRARWLRRIEQGRVWVWTENGRLIFNTTVMSETHEVFYLEGIYVNASERGRGYGLRCLSQLSSRLLERAQSLCLFVNEQNVRAQAFYQKAGFEVCANYDTVFLHLKN
jgi:ribosomal protein S18 acetylase RimI-like enzyme